MKSLFLLTFSILAPNNTRFELLFGGRERIMGTERVKVELQMRIDDLIEKCMEAPEIREERCSFGRKLRLEQGADSGFIHFLPLFPGIALAYIHIQALSWPAPKLYSEGEPRNSAKTQCSASQTPSLPAKAIVSTGKTIASASDHAPETQANNRAEDTSKTAPSQLPFASLKGPLLINYCVTGRCELLLNTDNYVYIQPGEISLTESFASNQYLYPGKIYEGMEFFMDLDSVSADAPWLAEEFGLKLSDLTIRYCPSLTTYIASADREADLIFRKLWSIYDGKNPRCLQQIKVYSLSLLASLVNAPVIAPADRHTFYTKYQVEIAKKAEQILTFDLGQHHPAHELAAAFSISETSLKNYFRGVYGENISSYMLKKRMEKAGELLLDTAVPVSAIALQTGYSSQSKFAAVFRKYYGTAPLEYRRRSRLG